MKKDKFEDDGRQIADMSDTYKVHFYEGFKRLRNRKPLMQKPQTKDDEKEIQPIPQLTKKETKSLMLNALLATLAIGSVFVIVIFLFIQFCIHIWFA